jgi:hypothetical protein
MKYFLLSFTFICLSSVQAKVDLKGNEAAKFIGIFVDGALRPSIFEDTTLTWSLKDLKCKRQSNSILYDSIYYGVPATVCESITEQFGPLLSSSLAQLLKQNGIKYVCAMGSCELLVESVNCSIETETMELDKRLKCEITTSITD